ncbi:MAG: ARMT1-like domain-containing protein [Candidatus Thermoplasmatota archaeon]
MKISTDCLPCILKRVIFEAKLSTNNECTIEEVIRKVCRELSNLYDPKVCSAEIATRIHGVTYKILKDPDPYRNLKRRSNMIAKELLPIAEGLIEDSSDRLKTSMLISIIGNTLDFGIEGGSSDPENLANIFEQLIKEGLGYDDYDACKDLIRVARSIILFTDNCGEVVFDNLLCKELKRFNSNLCISLVVKGEPVLSDATLDDIKGLSFEKYVDEILTTGSFAVGVDFRNIPRKVKNILDNVDVIICKGMANYESFSETDYRPVIYLLRTKCRPIATSMGIPQGVNAIKLYK